MREPEKFNQILGITLNDLFTRCLAPSTLFPHSRRTLRKYLNTFLIHTRSSCVWGIESCANDRTRVAQRNASQSTRGHDGNRTNRNNTLPQPPRLCAFSFCSVTMHKTVSVVEHWNREPKTTWPDACVRHCYVLYRRRRFLRFCQQQVSNGFLVLDNTSLPKDIIGYRVSVDRT